MAVIKVCLETPFSKKSYHIEIGQLIFQAINLLVFTVFTERYFQNEYSTGFLQRYAYLLRKKVVALIPWA